MEYTGLSYVFGLSTMFFGMMTLFFWRRGDRLHRLVALLMATITAGCVKDYVCIYLGIYSYPFYWNLFTSIDMVAVPMYAFVLMELVSPGKMTNRMMAAVEAPFVLLPVLFIITSRDLFFYLQVVLAGVFGTGYLIRASIEIPRYHRHLKERYSCTDNINLGWLKIIIVMFYAILGIWIVDCISGAYDLECLYMVCNLILWIVISFFLFRHESVIDELADYAPAAAAGADYADASGARPDNSLAARIANLFKTREIFLKPNLKLSDVAREIGSNRTYVSNYFNRDAATTFYDYVNTYRVDYACNLLATTETSIQEVADKSGFSSASVFARVFVKHKGCTPSAYRSSLRN